jgi:hypothetical protein
VEYYNPVHDLSLPLVFRALSVAAPDPPPAVFEIPLIRQASTAPSEAYIVQRPVPSRAASQVAYALTPAETAAKRQARDETYTILAAQLGPVLCTIPDQELATEVVVPAVLSPGIAPDCILRYEWRAQRLREQGAIEHPITFADHFLPLARALAGDRLQPLA